MTDRFRPDLTRRQCLAGLSALGLSGLGFADESVSKPTDPPTEAIRALAKKAGLDDLGTSQSAHYFGIGDAPARFRETALKLCEGLAGTYQKHFREKGFTADLPSERMTVVILSGRAPYAAFKGSPVGETEGGHYDVEANRLVMFDFQPDARQGGPDSSRLNTFTLVHEAMHQLTFATGLLDRQADVPLAISEGFATYGELWQLRNPKIGQVNTLRLKALSRMAGAGWIPLEKLLTRDELFNQEETEQVAYAEASLLIHTLMNPRPPSLKGKLRGYLKTIRGRKDSSKRIEDAQEAFGELARLDRDLKKGLH